MNTTDFPIPMVSGSSKSMTHISSRQPPVNRDEIDEKCDCPCQRDKRFFLLLGIIVLVLVKNAYLSGSAFFDEDFTNIAIECPKFNGNKLVMGGCNDNGEKYFLPGHLRPLFFEPVPINIANEATLKTLPGIGPALAKAILETRKERGVFQQKNDLLAVPGIGPGKLASLSTTISFEVPVARY